MGHIGAIVAAFRHQWLISARGSSSVSTTVNNLGIVIVLAWIAQRSDNPQVFIYVLIGAFFRVIWNNSSTRLGWLMHDELVQGTLQPTLATRTPLYYVLLGKALAQVTSNIVPGLVSSLAVVVISKRFLSLPEPALLVVSLVVALVSLVAIGFIWAPLYLLVGGQPGFFNAITPFVVVCSGFFFPIALLPAGLQPIGLALPSSWSVSALTKSLLGGASLEGIVVDWLAALVLSAIYLLLSLVMMQKVDARVRVAGTLA